jgi:tetratricopeptide (TPR) repeat protein
MSVVSSASRVSLGICLLLAAAVVVVYGQVATFEFVNFDDPVYIYENEHVTAGLTWEGVRWAFTSGLESNWLPLTRLSHMLDCELFGVQAGAHHVTNLLLHLANTILLYGVLQTMTGAVWRSAWVAGVFAVHPLHAESVAWVSERKDVLSTFFGLLALWGYVGYVRRPGWGRYTLALAAFAASLLAKQMLVTLPVLLLLLDLWPLARVPPWSAGRRLLIEKLPFAILAGAAACVAFVVQSAGGSVLSVAARPVAARFANAAVSYVLYVGQLVWPTGLTFYYPYHPWAAWQGVGAGAVLVGSSGIALWLGRHRPYVLVGWLWYLVALLPVIGLVQVGDQARADRYTYVPSVGLLLAVAWGVPDLVSRWPRRQRALGAIAVATIALCMTAAVPQVGTWRNSEALLGRALAVTPDNPLAHNNLGYERFKQGRLDAAIAHYEASIRYAPERAKARRNLGEALLQKGNVSAALAQLDIAAQLRPNDAITQQILADALAQVGRFAEAAPHYQAAITLGLRSPAMLNNLGVALAAAGDPEAGLVQFEAALTEDPENVDAHLNAARSLAELGRHTEAVVHLEAVLRSRPEDAAARVLLDQVLAGAPLR